MFNRLLVGIRFDLLGGRRYNLATTYSRGAYRTTTIGNAAFDGRVRDGIGSVHSFMVTKNLLENDLHFGFGH